MTKMGGDESIYIVDKKGTHIWLTTTKIFWPIFIVLYIHCRYKLIIEKEALVLSS